MVRTSTYRTTVTVKRDAMAVNKTMDQADVIYDFGDPGQDKIDFRGFTSAARYQTVVVDTNGDGVGDLQGLISKLDYLQDLGVKGLWLMPVTQSQDRDHGYAVKQYRDIETDYGSLDDLKAFIDSLNDDEQAELVALTWIGRGTFACTKKENQPTVSKPG